MKAVNCAIKEIINLTYGFIWKGTDKIKRSALINDIENGRLNMLDIVCDPSTKSHGFKEIFR